MTLGKWILFDTDLDGRGYLSNQPFLNTPFVLSFKDVRV